MTDSSEKRADAPAEGVSASHRWSAGRAALLIGVVMVAWFVLDRVTKANFDGYHLGESIGGPYAGIFEFTLVHNTGAAWGIFDDATFLLGLSSTVVSFAVAVLAIVFARRSNWVLSLGAGLIAAGGLGNALDRFMLGYVVDFINLSFIEFPVFNIADIGVTCGFVLVVIAFIFFWNPSEERLEADV